MKASPKSPVSWLKIVATVVLTAMIFGSPSAFAIDFVVTNGDDAGAGSLRGMVQLANTNGNPGEVDTITFAPDVTKVEQFDLHHIFGRGPMVITESLHIKGPGQKGLTIDGGYAWLDTSGNLNVGNPSDPWNTVLSGSDVLFDVGIRHTDNSAIEFTISGMTVIRSGGLVVGREGAKIEVDDVFLKENASPTQSDTGGGEMISVDDGSLVIKNSFISGNQTEAAIIISTGSTLIKNTTFVGNRFKGSFDATLFLTGNTTEIVDSQILDDKSQHKLFNGETYITNTVFKAMEYGYQSLIWADNTKLHLNNVTIYSHSNMEDQRSIGQPSHLWLTHNSVLYMANTVISNEQTTFTEEVSPMFMLEGGSTVAVNVSNFVSDGTLPGTATGVAGLEGPFVNPFSFKPAVPSHLIDTGDDAKAVDARTGVPLTTDIFGGERISGLGVEIGAVEAQANHAVNDSYATRENTVLTVTAPGVLSNDQVSGELINDRIFILAKPQHGDVQVVTGGLDFTGLGGGFIYTPNFFFHGIDSFEYVSVTVDANTSNRGHVTISVSPAAPARILVDKVTQPVGHTQVFDFRLKGGPIGGGDAAQKYQIDQSFSLADSDPSHDSGELTHGIYALTETRESGWVTHGSCDDGSPLDAIDLADGETVICTVTNVETDSIVVQVASTPGGGKGFGFTHDIGAGAPFSLDDQQSKYFKVEIDDTFFHIITQDDPAPSHYLESIVCQGDAETPVELDQRKVTIVGTFGQTAHCTFNNEARGRIMVEKVTSPGGNPQAFSFDLTGPDSFAQNFALTGGQHHDSGLVLPGTYSLVETVPAGWQQGNGVCDDGSDPASIDVAPGETITCTIHNVELDSVVVEMLTAPVGGTGFGFTHNIGAAKPFSLDDGQFEYLDSVAPGNYTITQDAPSGLGYVLINIICKGSFTDLVVDVATRQASFDLATGQTAYCTFLNEQEGKIIVDLVTDPPKDPLAFEFHLFGPGENQSFHLTDEQSPRSSGDVIAGLYHLSTVVPDAWQLDGIVCDDGSLHGDVDLQAGETVNCTVKQSLTSTASFTTFTKTAVPATLQPGGSVEYTITWENTGDADAVDSILSDVLPAGTTFISASDGGAYVGGTNTVSWDLGTIAASSVQQSVTLKLGVSPTTTIIENLASISFNTDRHVVARSIIRVDVIFKDGFEN